jgi:sec-independent protein translocase protein TatC
MGYECTAMGGDGRRSHDDSADTDEPLRSPSDDEESESSDFVFADGSDEDFVFSDTTDDSETNDDSDDILAPVTNPDSDSDSDSDSGVGTDRTDDESRDPSQPLSEIEEGRFDSDPASHTDDETEWDTNDPSTGEAPSSNSNNPRERSPENDRGTTETDVPWQRNPGANDETTTTSPSDSETSPYPNVDRDMSATDDRMMGEEEPARTETTATTKSDGGTLASGEAPVPDNSVDDSLVPSGPAEDQEMPLGEHIEEMVRRVLAVAAVMSIVAVAVFPFADQLITFIWYGILSKASADVVQPRVYHPLALVLARLKVSTLAGFVIALPVFVYQTYRFMRPGLYPRERRYYLASIPTSLVLAALGVAFAFFFVLPLIFIYFLGYSQGAAEIAFGLSDTFGLMLLMMGFFAVIFQIPLFIMLGVMMGVTSREWLAERRLYFWGVFLGIAFLTNPDPTGMVPFIVTIAMVFLFEATLLVLKYTDRG